MTIKIRRLIFYSLIAVFIILAFIIIPYSNGLVFDFKTLSFAKLGGIYLENVPADAEISANGLNIQVKQSFLKSGVLMANLFPKTYHVSIQKSGYQSWNKDIAVKPSLVTQIHPIVLLPENSSKEALMKSVKNIYPGADYLAIAGIDGKLKINGQIIKGTEFISWLANSNSALTFDTTSKDYFVIDAEQNNISLNISLLFKNLKNQNAINDASAINKIITQPSDQNKLLIATGKAIYWLDYNKSSLDIIKNGKYGLLASGNNETIFSDAKNIYSYDFGGQEVSTIAQISAISAEISPNGQFLAASDGNKLYLFDRSDPSQKPKELAQNPAYFMFSPDSKKIAIGSIGDWWIKIFFIGDDYELYGQKPMSSASFEIGTLDNNSPITWHANSSYIFLKYPGSLRLLEIDDSNPPTNIQVVNDGAEKYFYDSNTDTMYVIEKGIAYKMAFE